MFRAKVFVTLRKSILDPQGRTVERSLHNLGFDDANHVRVGKYVEFELSGPRERALERAHAIARDVLSNPVIEDYALELEELQPA